MASVVTNEFKRANAAAEVDLNADDMRAVLVMDTTTVDTENDGIVVTSGYTTLAETAGANYARQALANEAVNKDDANDRAEFDADDPVWTALGNGASDLQGVLIHKHVTNDADSIPCFFIEFAVAQSPGGSNFTINFDAEGIAQLS